MIFLRNKRDLRSVGEAGVVGCEQFPVHAEGHGRAFVAGVKSKIEGVRIGAHDFLPFPLVHNKAQHHDGTGVGALLGAYPEEFYLAAPKIRFFPEFSEGCLFGRLSQLNKSTGERPLALARFHGALGKEEFIVATGNKATGRWDGVAIVEAPAIGAVGLDALAVMDRLQGLSTGAAKIPCEGFWYLVRHLAMLARCAERCNLAGMRVRIKWWDWE